ncbi:hypothetical protein KSF_104250 [Reticulibacter mediterranei]|uniref:Methyltransferase domain-containing protein n=1 Tax=Reticulibacter mediterranei TaxID=2778369 RepID=A0A8J3J114_9CHLR|nr:hypothetical protein [Reticulibacter mediterranei]GHP00378.1 hypothetical protein KSF_104250 [Reticulibacter mediterranei]
MTEQNRYFIDTESAAEMARLLQQERLLTRAMGSLFPSDLDPTHLHRVLDIACGPGGWRKASGLRPSTHRGHRHRYQ